METGVTGDKGCLEAAVLAFHRPYPQQNSQSPCNPGAIADTDYATQYPSVPTKEKLGKWTSYLAAVVAAVGTRGVRLAWAAVWEAEWVAEWEACPLFNSMDLECPRLSPVALGALVSVRAAEATTVAGGSQEQCLAE